MSKIEFINIHRAYAFVTLCRNETPGTEEKRWRTVVRNREVTLRGARRRDRARQYRVWERTPYEKSRSRQSRVAQSTCALHARQIGIPTWFVNKIGCEMSLRTKKHRPVVYLPWKQVVERATYISRTKTGGSHPGLESSPRQSHLSVPIDTDGRECARAVTKILDRAWKFLILIRNRGLIRTLCHL